MYYEVNRIIIIVCWYEEFTYNATYSQPHLDAQYLQGISKVWGIGVSCVKYA